MPHWVHAYVLDPLERAGSTFVQQFVIVLLATSGSLVIFQDWQAAFYTALFAGIVSILTSLLTFTVPPQTPMVDLLLRTAKTFIQSLLGSMAATQFTDVVHFGWHGAIAVAIPVALTSFLKGMAAMAIAWSPGTASLLPAGPPAPANEPYAAEHGV